MRNRSVKKLVPLNLLLVAALILTITGPLKPAIAMDSRTDASYHPTAPPQQAQPANTRFNSLPQLPQLSAPLPMAAAGSAAALPQRQARIPVDSLSALMALSGPAQDSDWLLQAAVGLGASAAGLSPQRQETDTLTAPIYKSRVNSSQPDASPVRDFQVFLPLVSQSTSQEPTITGDPKLAAVRRQMRGLGIHSWDRYSRSPVSIATGNFVQQFTDLNIPGAAGFDLLLQHTYNSLDSRQGLFGSGWSSLLDMGLQLNSDGSVDVRYADGSGAFFQPDGTGYVAAQGGVFDLLSSSGGEFLLTTVDQKVYHFAVAGDAGLLVRINDRHGNEIRIERDGAGIPTQIVDSAGRVFEISHSGSGISEISDPLGRVISYQQDGLGNLTAVTGANGGSTLFSYENQWLTTLTDPEGIQYLTNSYDTQGRVTEQIDADGNAATFTYNTGQTIFVDSLGNTTIYTLDSDSRITQIIDALGNSEQFAYDSNHNVRHYTDKRGNVWHYDFNERGNLLIRTDALGYVINYSYNATNDLTSIRDQGGFDGLPRTTTFVYDSQGNLTQINRPDGSSQAATYDAAGQMMSMTDPLGNVSSYAYDSEGNQTQFTDPLGNSTHQGFDAVGRLLTVTDANGHTTAFEYDKSDNLVKQIDANGNTTHFEYDLNDCLIKVIDRRGGAFLTEYDRKLNVLAETDPEGHRTAFSYDAMGNRVSMTDPLGRQNIYRYDALYRLVEVEDALGNLSQYEYDANGNITKVIDSLGQATSFVYDALNRRSSEINPLGHSIGRIFDEVGRLVMVVGPRGGNTFFEYDVMDRMVWTRNPLGHAWKTTYDAAGNILSQTDPNGGVTSFSYDAGGRLVATTDPEEHTTTRAYDSAGNVARVTDALGAQTRYEYDATDRLIAVVDALGGRESFSLDQEGNQISFSDANGNTTHYTYNGDGLLIAMTEAGGQLTSYRYDAAHNLTAVVDANGSNWGYAFDGLNQRISDIDPLGQTTGYRYNEVGQLTAVTDSNGIITGYSYDALGQLTAVVQNAVDGQPADHQTNVTTSYDYDADGNLILINDANGESSSFSYDLLGRQTGEIDPLGNSWSYQYDALGNLTARTDANGNTTLYSYDGDGLQLGVSYPDGSGVSYAYDAAHHQIGMSDGLGDTQNEYDLLGRLLTTSNHLGQTVSYQYDAAGNRTSITYPAGEIVQYAYDQSNLPMRVIDSAGNLFEASRDAAHNITAITYPNQTTTAYTMDAAGRLTSISSRNGSGDIISAFDYQLDPAGNRIGVAARYAQQPYQLNTAYQYDPLYRLSRSEDSQGRFAEYSYDAVGNRTQMAANFNPNSTRETQVFTADYSYNGANQLLTTLVETQADGQLKQNRSRQVTQAVRAFIHETEAQSGHHIGEAAANSLLQDAQTLLDLLAGDPAPGQADVAAALTALSDGVKTAALSGEIDNQGIVNSLQVKLDRARAANESQHSQLAASLYFYDANGNRIRQLSPNTKTAQTKDGLRTDYSYDFENRLVQVQNFTASNGDNWNAKGEIVQRYDGYGRMFSRTRSSEEWRSYVYDGLAPIMIFNSDDSTSILTRGMDQILSVDDNQDDGQGGMTYFHYDGLGSVTGLTNHQGKSIHNYWYDAFGTILDNNGHAADASNFTAPHNRFTYSGQEWDEHTELFHFYAREYDPQTGTWLQQDPMRGRPSEPMSLHRYQFVGNNPMTYADQLGFSRKAAGGPDVSVPVFSPQLSCDFTSSPLCQSRPAVSRGTQFSWSPFFNFIQNTEPFVSLPGEQLVHVAAMSERTAP